MNLRATLGATALAVGVQAHSAIAAMTAPTAVTTPTSGPTPLPGAPAATHSAAAAAGHAAAAAERTPLNLGQPSGVHASIPGGGGGGLFRTVIGLAVVVALIWGLSWVLRQVKASKEGKATGGGLTSIGTLPLGPGRAVHIVRAGSEVLRLGSADHHVSQLARYSEDEARAAGLLDLQAPVPVAPGAAVVAGSSKLLDALRSWTVRK